MNKFKKIVICIAVVLCVAIIGCFVYLNDYYKAEDIAIEVMNSSDRDNIYSVDNLTVLKGTSEKGVIFYPGAKVEAIAYLPILQKLQNEGLTCVLVEMPFNMAIFNVNGADKVFEELSDIGVEEWYMAGHSMGGGMASAYASENSDLIEGLILMGAYVYGDYPPEKAVTIYGTHNSNLKESIDYTDNIVIIEGGNHAQFGNYGKQKDDPDADITTEEQQDITVEAVVEFVGLQ